MALLRHVVLLGTTAKGGKRKMAESLWKEKSHNALDGKCYLHPHYTGNFLLSNLLNDLVVTTTKIIQNLGPLTSTGYGRKCVVIPLHPIVIASTFLPL